MNLQRKAIYFGALCVVGVLCKLMFGCASVGEAVGEVQHAAHEADPVLSAAAQAVDLIKARLAPAAVEGANMCAALPATCEPLADAQKLAEAALDAAKLGIEGYRAGQMSVETVAAALEQAADFVDRYIDVVTRLRKAVAQLEPSAGVTLVADTGPLAVTCTAPLKPKLVCVGSFCFWTCQR